MSGQKCRALLAAAFLIVGVSADAAELRVLSTVAVKAVMEELIPQFERASGDKVVIQFGKPPFSRSKSTRATYSTSPFLRRLS